MLSPALNHCLCLFLADRIQYGRIGSDVTMQCGSLDNDASVSWKMNGTYVKAQHSLEGPRLILTNVSLNHTGLYTCFQKQDDDKHEAIFLQIGSKYSSLLPIGRAHLPSKC